MSVIEFLQSNHSALMISAVLFGLIIGSFLNVVINRLPVMMENEWREQCAELGDGKTSEIATYNLITPRSKCMHCGHQIKAIENIPILSYLFLKGKCSHCSANVSLQYPLIEALTALLTVFIILEYGLNFNALAALCFTYALIALSIIDIKHMLLPDHITLPILWLGLLISIPELFVTMEQSILGASLGYMLLWSVYQAFKLLTKKEGMGYGDFKLLAMLGAWLGWQSLPLLIILSSLAGAVVGCMIIILMKKDKQQPIPFGPYLAIAGWITLIWGQEITSKYAQWLK